jgi:hypothetical protein
MQSCFPYHQLATSLDFVARSPMPVRFLSGNSDMAGGLLIRYWPERLLLAQVFIGRQ